MHLLNDTRWNTMRIILDKRLQWNFGYLAQLVRASGC